MQSLMAGKPGYTRKNRGNQRVPVRPQQTLPFYKSEWQRSSEPIISFLHTEEASVALYVGYS